MMTIPLRAGLLAANGYTIRRSGINWLCRDGHLCRANEPVGYCNITVEPSIGLGRARRAFIDELELQVILAPRLAGRLQIVDSDSPGGYLNVFGTYAWEPETVLAYLQASDPDDVNLAKANEFRLLFVAGRRMTQLADQEFGLLPGWHNRTRAWWGDDAGELSSLLCLGICDVTAMVQGSRLTFVELFALSQAASHVTSVPACPLVPCAPILLEQLGRTAAQMEDIANELGRALTAGNITPTASDWLFAGSLLSALQQSSISDKHDFIMSGELQRSGPADVVLLSLHAEGQSILRHKKLGYSIHILRHHQAAAGPAIQAWIQTAFEPVKRNIDDIRRDYLELADAVGRQTGARLLIANRMSTSGQEDISDYSPFSHPMAETLENIASKQLNLMLHDICGESNVAILDIDAIAAELGGGRHLPDGIHQSESLQAALRSEMLQLMQARA
jgi:hypothetical protein